MFLQPPPINVKLPQAQFNNPPPIVEKIAVEVLLLQPPPINVKLPQAQFNTPPPIVE